MGLSPQVTLPKLPRPFDDLLVIKLFGNERGFRVGRCGKIINKESRIGHGGGRESPGKVCPDLLVGAKVGQGVVW